MTSAQKVIKYIAIAFAIFLIITIISAVVTAFYELAHFFGLKDNTILTQEMIETSFQNTDINSLEIDVKYTNLIIKTGEQLKVETNKSNITCKQNNNDIQIKEKNYNFFSRENKGDLIVYIPADLEFSEVKINTGAGRVSVEKLATKKLSFELGAGETQIKALNVLSECEIEGGAGKVEVLSGTINDLDLDIGVGKIDLNVILTGDSEINAGIGSLNINVQESKEKYKIKVDKGLGSIKIDEKEASDDVVYGDGENSIKVDGGIGNIEIDFKK